MKNNGLSSSTYDSLEQDVAIRRFCAARVELDREQGGSLNWEDQFMNEIELWPLDDATNTGSSCQLGINVNEGDGFIDSFINMDYCSGDQLGSSNSVENSNQSCGVFEEKVGALSVVNNGLCEEVPMVIEGDELPIEECTSNDVVNQGVYLVNLLLSCAEAVGCRDIRLAPSLLNQVLASSSPWGDSLQRVSYSFAMGLKTRLSLLLNGAAGSCRGAFGGSAAVDDASLISWNERKEAYQLLHQTTPYIAFGFMVANEAIHQAVQGSESIHIIDLGMEHTLQWPSLLRSLASREQASPKLRITAIAGSNANCFDLESSLNSLVHDAKSLGMSLEFNVINKENVSPSLLTKENLNLRQGEFLVMNSIMHLHKYVRESRGSLKAILQAIRKLNPALLTVVEQDANHNGPFFLGRFLESLHYYSAIFDSLEASLPRTSLQRIKIESSHFAEQIHNIVASEGSDRVERHEKADQWRRQLGRAGFQIVGLKCMSQVRMMLSVYGCDGYTLSNEKGCLLLGWKGRPIILASAWQVHTVSPSN
ncbi:hypothetical protein Syun_010802 [Stephania yunnanensis]|uniref:Uncharacterized protein n=1 Tax=Stephania yunnanensis TaxID=152371 RepID=A0AAP0KIQ7_9MAGN